MSTFARLKFLLGTVCLLAAAVPATGCRQAGSEADQANVAFVEDDDPKMEAAKAKGRATLPGFFERMAAPSADEEGFSVKFNLTPDADAEFIWAGDLKLDARGELTGALSNHPIDERFKLGQRVPIARSDIIDWTYFKNGVAQGHHTTRVILEQVTPEEAAEIRAALGW